jgi:non-heme chloroperoxidase
MAREKSVRSWTSNEMLFEARGQGRPLILLHGWCLNRRLWLYAEEALLTHYRVMTPDLAGFGQSDHLTGPYSLERYADDVRQLLLEEDLKDAVLIGFAFGAAVALEVAAQGGTKLGGIVSVGVPGASHSPYERMGKAIRRDWPDFARRSAKALFHTLPSEATLAWLEHMFASAPLPVAIETLDVLAHYEPETVASKVKVPTLFLHADSDTVAPAELGHACAAKAANARVEVLADCGHLIVIERKDAFHDAVRAFVSAL